MENSVDVGGWSLDKSPNHVYYHEREGNFANVYPARLNPEADCWQDDAGRKRLHTVKRLLDEIAVGGEAVAKVLPNSDNPRSVREAQFAALMQPDADGTAPTRIVPVLDIVKRDDRLRTVFASFGGPAAILFMPRLHQFAVPLGNPDPTRLLVWESLLHRFGGPAPELAEDRRAPWQLRGEAYREALDAATDLWLRRHGLEELASAPTAAITTAVLKAGYETAAALCEASELFEGGQLWHRDLKPSQILVDRQGQLRVTDFGMSFHSDEEERLTISRYYIAGTDGYLTPRMIEALNSFNETVEQSDLVTMADVTAVEDTWALGITAAVLYLHTSSPVRPGETDTVAPTLPFGRDAYATRLDRMYDRGYHRDLLRLFPPQLQGVLAAFLAPCPNRGRSKQPPLRPGQQQAKWLLGAVLGEEEVTLSADAHNLVAELGKDQQVVDGLTLQQAVVDTIDATSDHAHAERVELLTQVAAGLALQTRRGTLSVQRQLEKAAAYQPVVAALGLARS